MHNDKRREQFIKAFVDAPTTGHVIECGVGGGRSMRQLIRLASPNQQIFGFDSFEGLPEEWQMSDDYVVPAGSFKHDPPDLPRVEYYVGWFEDTLPKWKKEHPGRIAFLHIDSDIYSSCKTVLEELNDQIVPRTVIVFDEMYETDRYKHWKHGEYKACNEWVDKYNRKLFSLGASEYGEASFRVLQ